MSEDTMLSPLDRLLSLERRTTKLEKELADLRAEKAGSEQWLDASLRSLSRRVISGRPNSSYFNMRFRAFEAALTNIRALGHELGRVEASRALNRSAPMVPPEVSLNSKLCTKEDIDSEWALFWSKEMKSRLTYHRKLWEFVYIAQALYRAGKLAPENFGLGFGCGSEPLPSVFVKYGAQVVATDLADEVARSIPGLNSNCHMKGLNYLRQTSICPDPSKLENISFRDVDMNHIPEDFAGRFRLLLVGLRFGASGND